MVKLTGYYTHKIAPSPADKIAEFEISGNAFSNKNTLGKALRQAGILPPGGRLKHFRVEGDRVFAFPMSSVWHCITLRVKEDDSSKAVR